MTFKATSCSTRNACCTIAGQGPCHGPRQDWNSPVPPTMIVAVGIRFFDIAPHDHDKSFHCYPLGFRWFLFRLTNLHRRGLHCVTRTHPPRNCCMTPNFDQDGVSVPHVAVTRMRKIRSLSSWTAAIVPRTTLGQVGITPHTFRYMIESDGDNRPMRRSCRRVHCAGLTRSFDEPFWTGWRDSPNKIPQIEIGSPASVAPCWCSRAATLRDSERGPGGPDDHLGKVLSTGVSAMSRPPPAARPNRVFRRPTG